MLVGFASFVHSEVFLKNNSSKDRAFWTFEHAGWNFDELSDLFLVGNAVIHFLFTGFVKIFSGQLNKRTTINISQLHVKVSQQLLKIHQNKANRPPFIDISPPKTDKLRCLIDELALPKHELM